MKLLLETFQKAVDKEETGRGKILQITKAFYEYIQNHSDFYRLNLASRSPRFTAMHQLGKIDNSQKYIQLTQDLLNITLESVKLGIEDGSMRKDLDPLQTSLFLGSAIESAAYISPEYKMLLDQLKIPPEKYLQHSIEILLKGISSNPSKD